MKLKKIISSLLVAAMAMSMSVLSFAANEDKYIFFDQAEYVEGENVTVNVYLNATATEVDTYTFLSVSYGADAFDFVSGTSSIATARVTGDVPGIVRWEEDSGTNKAVADATAPFMTLVFEVKDAAKIADVPFAIISDDMYTDTSFSFTMSEGNVMIGGSDVLEKLGSMTVEAATPAEPVPGTVGTKDGYTTVVDDDKATRFVITDTKASIAATAASVLKVTYDGDSKSANLYNLLGVDPEATGDVTIGSLTIKMVLPADVQDAADIADYSFIVE